MKSCLVIAGENSGEEHALSFIKQIKSQVADVEFFGVGGDRLQNEGMELLYHLNDFSSWGINDVIAKLPFYFKSFDHIVDEVKKRHCKVAILIDNQEFNLRMALKLKANGVNVLYYVAPQAWAWRPGRAKKLAKCVHTLFTIIPFEKKWFGDRGVPRVKSVLHPLKQHYEKQLIELQEKLGDNAKPFFSEQENPEILLLPGSRNSEVKLMLPEFVKAVQRLRKKFSFKVSIVKASSVQPHLFDIDGFVFDHVYKEDQLPDALVNAYAAFASSGTVTLCTALFQVPTVVAYKTSLLTDMVADCVTSYSGPASLANIVHEKRIFPEFIRGQCHDLNLYYGMLPWLTKKDEYVKIKNTLKETLPLTSGEDFDVAGYMSEVIKKSYA